MDSTLQNLNERDTHQVTNQPPPLHNYNLYLSDPALQQSVTREGGQWAEDSLSKFGAAAGAESTFEWGDLANCHTPVLKTHDRFGNRIDDIEFHPAWHSLFRLGINNELHSLPWTSDQPVPEVVRSALFMMLGQIDGGVMCPISMTHSAVPALSASPEIEQQWRPLLTLADYDKGALCGMALTEKQGGSDVGSNTTIAQHISDNEYLLTGHKWFCSHPVCDLFLVLARIEGADPGSRGLSCFAMPRKLPDGSKNRMQILRLKDKIGTRSLASGEVEYDGAWAQLLGEPGRGVPTILEMVNHTRLDCVLGSASCMRMSVSQATHHAAYRTAFGNTLIDQPLMQNVLADLCIESEAATVSGIRLARAFDDDSDEDFKRVATPILKYLICKRAPHVAVEALECLGGNGYVEESMTARLFRDSQVNSTWEGSGNVIALDMLRALAKQPQSIDALMSEFDHCTGINGGYDRQLKKVKDSLGAMTETDPQYIARSIVEDLAITLQAALLLRAADSSDEASKVADAFIASRLDGKHTQFGTLPPGIDVETIIERNRPKV